MLKKTKTKPIENFDRPLTTVDVVIFAVLEAALHVLLIKRDHSEGNTFSGHWALPGGFVNTLIDDSLEACALRKLLEKTGVSDAYLEQLGSWGSKNRDPRGWSASHVYFSLIPADRATAIRAGANASDVAWFKVSGLTASTETQLELAFDHNRLLSLAIQRLRSKVEYTSLPAFLVAKEFTLPELQRAYEIVLGRELDKSSFRTRILSSDLVQELPRMRQGQKRPAQLYILRSQNDAVVFPRTIQTTFS